MDNQELTFGGYPITFTKVDGEILITCKGLTGTLTQIDNFLKKKTITRYKFGDSNIRTCPDKKVRIDCLTDTKKQMEFLYKQAQELKNG